MLVYQRVVVLSKLLTWGMSIWPSVLWLDFFNSYITYNGMNQCMPSRSHKVIVVQLANIFKVHKTPSLHFKNTTNNKKAMKHTVFIFFHLWCPVFVWPQRRFSRPAQLCQSLLTDPNPNSPANSEAAKLWCGKTRPVFGTENGGRLYKQ